MAPERRGTRSPRAQPGPARPFWRTCSPLSPPAAPPRSGSPTASACGPWLPPSPRPRPGFRPPRSEGRPHGWRRLRAEAEARLPGATPSGRGGGARRRQRPAWPDGALTPAPARSAQGHGAAAAAAAVRGRPPLVRALRQPRRQRRHGGWQEKASKVAAAGDVREEVSGLPAPVLPVHGEPGRAAAGRDGFRPCPVLLSPLPCTPARPSPAAAPERRAWAPRVLGSCLGVRVQCAALRSWGCLGAERTVPPAEQPCFQPPGLWRKCCSCGRPPRFRPRWLPQRPRRCPRPAQPWA